MGRSKKIFVALVVLFVLLLAYASYDISSRTTFPGSKPQLQERLKKNYLPGDTATDARIERTDTLPGTN